MIPDAFKEVANQLRNAVANQPKRIIVSGSGRCGSSMLMWMLEAGGIQCAGSWPDFEDDRAMSECDPNWVAQYEGAMKILDPHRCLPDLEYRLDDAKCIWLDRDRKQQARSWVKVSRDVVGRDVGKANVPGVARKLKKARRPGVQRLIDVCGCGPLELTYEGIIAKPRTYAQRIADHLEMDLDINAMVGCVFDRPTTCLDNLLERDMVKMGRENVEEMIRQQRGLPKKSNAADVESVRAALHR